MDIATAPVMPQRERRRRRRRQRRRTRRRLLLIVFLVLLGALGLAIWTSIPAVRAAQDARRQVSALQAARTTLHQMPAGAELAMLDGHVRQLASDMSTIDSAWNIWRWPALFLSQAIPSAHDQLTQLDTLVTLGTQVTRESHQLLQALIPVVARSGASLDGASAPALVSRLAGVRPTLQSLAAQFQAADDLRQQIDDANLPGSLRNGIRLVNEYLPEAPAALRGLAALPAALGADGPRTYLLVPENNEDLRATGGFIGTVAVLRVDRGHVRLVRVESSVAVEHGLVPDVYPPLPLALHGWGAWYFRDANWSADFPTSAQLLALFYKLGTHQRVDGVIAITPAVLSTLLTLTGPVAVPGYQTTLTADNAFATLDAYVNTIHVVNKAFAAAAYRAIFNQLLAAPHAVSTALMDLVRQNVAAHDLQIFCYDPAVERAIRGLHMDGAINPTTGDYLYVVDTNLSTNKVNQLIQEHISYGATIQLDHSMQATVTIRYINDADAESVPVQNGDPTYADFLRVFVPAGSTLISASGFDQPWPTLTVHDKTEFAGYFVLPSHQTRTITLQYRIPPNAERTATYTLYVQRQPGSGAIPFDATISGMAVANAQDQLQTVLTHDVTLSTPLLGGWGATGPAPAPPPAPLLVPGAHPEPWVTVPSTLHAPLTLQTSS